VGQQKDALNRARHGITFETGARVFDDLNYVLRKDRIDEDGEQRWHAIGMVEVAVLMVVHVYRKEDEHGEEITRIISAREANKRERRIYFQKAAQ
jgi:uncharacterized DUF497 family protein